MTTQERVTCQHKNGQDGRDFGKVIPSKLWFSSPASRHDHHYPNELPLDVVMGVEGEEREREGRVPAARSSPRSCSLRPLETPEEPEKQAGPPQP